MEHRVSGNIKQQPNYEMQRSCCKIKRSICIYVETANKLPMWWTVKNKYLFFDCS